LFQLYVLRYRFSLQQYSNSATDNRIIWRSYAGHCLELPSA